LRGIFALGNSKGLFAYYGQQISSVSVIAEGEDSSGWARQEGISLEELNPEALAATAIEKAIKSRNPRPIMPGEYTVILEPAAVASLIWFLVDGFNALSYHEGRSFLKNRLGQRLAGENFTMLDDAYHPLYRERPFDDEGVLKKKVILFDRGVAANLVYSRKEAWKHKKEPTGHGLQVPNPWGARAGNIVVAGGENSIEEMIRTTEKGLLVTRFWYNRLVDPMQVIVTGMTRDGTFLIEEGKIKYGLRNLRFNQSVLEMLKNIRALSPAIQIERMVVPAMKVDHFTFTSTTEF
jgi:predicted Zn-dependent protease